MDLQPAQVALVQNLLHPDYVQILCGSLDNLPVAFAKLNALSASAPTKINRGNRWAGVFRCVRILLKQTDHQQADTPVGSPYRPSTPAHATVS